MKIETENLRRFTMYGLLVVAVALIAFTSQDWTDGESSVARRVMPELVVPKLGGGSWRLSQHRGDVVLINFWATWCPPCRQETPGLVKLAQEYSSRGLVVAGISLDEGGESGIQSFVKDFHVPYPVLIPEANAPYLAGIESLPTTVLIDRSGRVAKTYMGAVREATFEKDVTQLLAEKAPVHPKSSS